MMEIKGMIHCFFEQSGTFKNEFLKLGIPAADYDIQNNFNQTDYVVDLFSEIEKSYEGGASIFDKITKNDLIIAFFPCVYFSCLSQISFTWACKNYKRKTLHESSELILERSRNREKFYAIAIKMLTTAKEKGLRMIMENPWSENTYLKSNFVIPPSLIDKDRTLRGDIFKKPTAYWFINCEPTYHSTLVKQKEQRRIQDMKSGIRAGVCSEERSMISPIYARNFICDFIIGKDQKGTQLRLFD